MIASQQNSFGYADTLFGFPKFPAEVRENSRFPIKQGSSHSVYVPEVDQAYVFRKEHVRVLQFWMTGSEKNVLLQGETGTGKTTLIEQVAARLNWPVFVLGCHGGLEFQELVGRVTLQPDGSTGWADGPLISAMRFGGIFLLDEMNFLKPEVAGGLNTILQATAYTIPETGECVKAHPDFRIGATGNAIDGGGKSSYRGTQVSNIALLARFNLGIRIEYMTPADEQKMIEAKAPKIQASIAHFLSELADMARKSYSSGVLKAPLSPRETIAMAQRLQAFSGSAKAQAAVESQAKAMRQVMQMTFMFRWSLDDQNELMSAAKQVAQRLGMTALEKALMD
jgi:cobaltochelatase CobS